MKLFQIKIMAAVAGFALLISAPAMSQFNEGTLGSTSSATMDVQIELIDVAKVTLTDESDIVFEDFNGITTPEQTLSACIYHKSTPTVNLKTTSSVGGSSNAYLLQNTTTGTQVPYEVFVTFDTLADSLMSHDVNFTGLVGETSRTRATTCGGTPNASFRIVPSRTDLLGSDTGTYTDTLNIVVSLP